MTHRTIRDWQRDAHALAVAKGWYDCTRCGDAPGRFDCCLCRGRGRVDTTDPIWIVSRLERIHGEISEAGECVALGEMALLWKAPYRTPQMDKPWLTPERRASLQWHGYKPEGFGIELADVFLRLVELAEALGVELTHEQGIDPSSEADLCGVYREVYSVAPVLGTVATSALLCRLHDFVPSAYFAELDSGERQRELSCFFRELLRVAAATDTDLLAMAELKHNYNTTRPYRHGNKRV